ncbi:MAG: translation initiation factor, partial [Marmoricola sp.]|nr:translation initiation factor [Marmoricola sp.]
MANTRVSDLAKKYGVPSKEVIGLLGDLGEFVKAPSSGINPLVEKRFNDTYGADLTSRAEASAAKKAAKKAPARPGAPTPGPASARTAAPSEASAAPETSGSEAPDVEAAAPAAAAP